MPRETMTPKERWLAVLERGTPDRVPMDYWGTQEANQKLKEYLGCERMPDAFERLHIDRVVDVAPKYVGPPIPLDEDVYGCKRRWMDYGTGAYLECVSNPLAQYDSVEEIERNYTWPSLDWFDYSEIRSRVEARPQFPVRGGGSEPFLTYKDLRGMEQSYMDLVVNPEIVRYCLDKLFGFAYENTVRIYEQIPGKVTFTFVSEDFGSQEGLLLSPALIREFFMPWMKRMIDLVHQAGAYVFHHSDGAVRAIVPDMVEAGIDILNPIQWRCKGMDREELKRSFGDEVIFHGGVDNQRTLAFGSVEDVRQEVLDNLRILGAGGGYILAPCHNIQAVSPPENIVAMYETGYENGWT